MPINEWSRERQKGLRLLQADLAAMSDADLAERLRAGKFTDPRVRALAEAELARRQPGDGDR